MMPDDSGVHGALAPYRDGWAPETTSYTREKGPSHVFAGPTRWWPGQTTWASRWGCLWRCSLQLLRQSCRGQIQVLVMCRCMMLQSTAGLALWSGQDPGDLMGLAARHTPALMHCISSTPRAGSGPQASAAARAQHAPVLAAVSEAHACVTRRAGDSQTACSLFWESDKLLYIGWSCMVQVGQSAP